MERAEAGNHPRPSSSPRVSCEKEADSRQNTEWAWAGYRAVTVPASTCPSRLPLSLKPFHAPEGALLRQPSPRERVMEAGASEATPRSLGRQSCAHSSYRFSPGWY